MDSSLTAKIDQACHVAEEFCKLFYGTIDKRRHLITKLYMDTALLSWNGNGIPGAEAIQKYLTDLPASEHTYKTLDAHPIMGIDSFNMQSFDGVLSLSNVIEKYAYDSQTFLIQVSGHVRYQDKVPKSYQQSFVITANNDKWKIVTDCFRLQEPITEKY